MPQRAERLIEKLITEEDVAEFWVGNYGEFDRLAGNIVLRLKLKYPHIVLNLVVPYVTEKMNQINFLYYERYDEIIMADMPVNTPIRLKILKCNQYMVKNARFLICYVKNAFGGAAKTLEYAERQKHIKIFNLCEKAAMCRASDT